MEPRDILELVERLEPFDQKEFPLLAKLNEFERNAFIMTNLLKNLVKLQSEFRRNANPEHALTDLIWILCHSIRLTQIVPLFLRSEYEAKLKGWDCERTLAEMKRDFRMVMNGSQLSKCRTSLGLHLDRFLVVTEPLDRNQIVNAGTLLACARNVFEDAIALAGVLGLTVEDFYGEIYLIAKMREERRSISA